MKFESERLRYERITRQHAPELQAELCDPQVCEHIDGGKPPTPDEFLNSFVQREAGPPAHRSTETWIDCAVRSKQTGQAIGRVEATVLAWRAEVAYLFGCRHWGFGYAFEAVTWLQQRLADAHAVRECWASVNPANQRSVALLKRLGYAEPARTAWPARLTSYDDGDRVFHRPVAPSHHVAPCHTTASR